MLFLSFKPNVSTSLVPSLSIRPPLPTMLITPSSVLFLYIAQTSIIVLPCCMVINHSPACLPLPTFDLLEDRVRAEPRYWSRMVRNSGTRLSCWVGPWRSHLASLCLSFLTYQKEYYSHKSTLKSQRGLNKIIYVKCLA